MKDREAVFERVRPVRLDLTTKRVDDDSWDLIIKKPCKCMAL
jgi:hypothetical protein